MLKLRYDLSIWESAMFGGGDDDPALNFDGTSIYGELTHPVTFTGDFEIHVTFNTTAHTVALFGESSSNDTLLYLVASGVLHARFASSTSRASTTVVNDGEDHTARMVRTGTTVELYVDGDLEATATEAVADSVVNLIGNNQFSLYFDGQIPLIKFIDKSGASDVIQTYQINSGPPVYEKGVEVMRSDDWATPPTGVTVSGNTATFSGSQATWAGVNINAGDTYSGAYCVSVKITGVTQGSCRVEFGSDGGDILSANGVYSSLEMANGETLRVKDYGSDGSRFDGSVEILSVKPYISTISDGTLYQMIAGGSLGSELVVNGGFDTDSDWVKSNSGTPPDNVVEITGGKGHIKSDGTYTQFYQDILTIGERYLVSGEMEVTSGSGKIQPGDGAPGVSAFSVTGVNTAILNCNGSNGRLYLGRATACEFYADNVTVKALPECIIFFNVEPPDWT